MVRERGSVAAIVAASLLTTANLLAVVSDLFDWEISLLVLAVGLVALGALLLATLRLDGPLWGRACAVGMLVVFPLLLAWVVARARRERLVLRWVAYVLVTGYLLAATVFVAFAGSAGLLVVVLLALFRGALVPLWLWLFAVGIVHATNRGSPSSPSPTLL